MNRRNTTELTALTLNIHHGEGTDGRLDMERIARVIEAQRADVVALQEVDRHYGPRSDGVDQAWELGRRLGVTPLFGANLRLPPPRPGKPQREYGIALLTKHPVVSWDFVPLPLWPGHEARGLLRAELDVGDHPVNVWCAHLSNEAAESRTAQAATIAGEIEPDRPLILLGDFNAGPDSPELAPLLERLADQWSGRGSDNGFTFPAEQPRRRIDYVLASRSVAAREITVVPVDGATDHLGLRAVLDIGQLR